MTTLYAAIAAFLVYLILQLAKRWKPAAVQGRAAHIASMVLGLLAGLIAAYVDHHGAILALLASGALAAFLPAGVYHAIEAFIPALNDALAKQAPEPAGAGYPPVKPTSPKGDSAPPLGG